MINNVSNIIDVFECDAEAIICGESYDVKVICGPNNSGLCVIDVLFSHGFTERIAVNRKNLFPRKKSAAITLMAA